MTQSESDRATDLAAIERVVVLQTTDLFHFCRAEEVLRISALTHEGQFAAGETIYERKQPADTLYCVVRGAVRLDGPQAVDTRVGPLQTFGAAEILTGRLRTETAKAETDTLVLTIDAEDFFDLLANNIEIVRALFRQLLDAERPNSNPGRD